MNVFTGDFITALALILICIVLLIWNGDGEWDDEEVEQIDIPKPRCPWCQDDWGNTDLDFSVIDDDFGQYVRYQMINFCPFCGRSLKDDTD